MQPGYVKFPCQYARAHACKQLQVTHVCRMLTVAAGGTQHAYARPQSPGAGPAPKFMGLVGPAPVAKTPPESTRTATTVRPDNVGARSAAVHRVRRRLRPSTPHLRQSPSHAARQRLAQVPRPRRHAQRVELHRKPACPARPQAGSASPFCW